MDQIKMVLWTNLNYKNVYTKNSKFINLKYNFYVLADNRAKIDKQCEHCTKLE